MYKWTTLFEYKIATECKSSEIYTLGKGVRVKIPLLPNRVGKRSGTMTMVTTLLLIFEHSLINAISYKSSKGKLKKCLQAFFCLCIVVCPPPPPGIYVANKILVYVQLIFISVLTIQEKV